MEFINSDITNRKKLFRYFSLALAFILLSFCLKFVFAPTDVQEGIRHSRRMFSYNEFVFFSVTAIIIYLVVGISTKIVLKIIISEIDKTMQIDVIERFKFKSVSYNVKLSETQIQKSITDNKGEEIISLVLTNKYFGSITISSTDFKDIYLVVDYFENLRISNAIVLRKKRLLKKR